MREISWKYVKAGIALKLRMPPVFLTTLACRITIVYEMPLKKDILENKDTFPISVLMGGKNFGV